MTTKNQNRNPMVARIRRMRFTPCSTHKTYLHSGMCVFAEEQRKGDMSERTGSIPWTSFQYHVSEIEHDIHPANLFHEALATRE